MAKKSNRMSLGDVENLPGWAKEQILRQLKCGDDEKKASGLCLKPVEQLYDETRVKGQVARLKLSMPLYLRHKEKNIFLGMNIYRNAHWSMQNRMKKFIAEAVYHQARSLSGLKAACIKAEYMLYYKNSNCDAMNVISFIDKAVLDALQVMNIITDDTVKEYIGGKWCVVEKDRNNPRLDAVFILRGEDEAI